VNEASHVPVASLFFLIEKVAMLVRERVVTAAIYKKASIAAKPQ